MNKKKEIVKIISGMAGNYSPDIIFADWVECLALAVQNSCCMIHNSVWESREKKYIAIMKKYEKQERQNLIKMNVLLIEAMQENMSDILGEIYMESGCGSKHTGQFFTPFNISMMTAGTVLKDISPEKKLVLNEPSVGGGGMIIAVAKALRDKGVNYQKCMEVTAQDLDWRSVYMAYVQFSFLGISAEVVQGNTLSEPYVKGKYKEECVFRTPAKMGMLI